MSHPRPGNQVTSSGAVSARTAQPSQTACRVTLGRFSSNMSLLKLKTHTTVDTSRPDARTSSTTARYSSGP